MNANFSSPLPVRTLPIVGTPKRKRDEPPTEYDGIGNSGGSNAAIFFPRPTSTATTPSAEALQPDVRASQEPSDGGPPSSSAASPSIPARDGSSSPRSRVVHRFRSLAIGEGSGETEPLAAAMTDDSPVRRKRMRLLGEERGWEEGLDGGDKDRGASRRGARPASPSASRMVVDAVRASLTWQEDEITVYDPDDADDDGTGVNGVGFKPTPAIARARALKRRQQLAEYRKREEREARARRSLQRRTRAAAAEEEAMRIAEAATAVVAAMPADTGAAIAAPTRLASIRATPPAATDDADATAETAAIPSVHASPRRVRFLETGPTTIHFLEPEPTAVLSS